MNIRMPSFVCLLLPLLSLTYARTYPSTRLYDRLGISKTANETEIQKAYRTCALRHHPDKVPADQREKASEEFKEITEAYEILSDSKKRKWYDEYGDVALQPNFHPNGFSNHSYNQNNNNHNKKFQFHTSPEFNGGNTNADLDLSSIFQQFFGMSTSFPGSFHHAQKAFGSDHNHSSRSNSSSSSSNNYRPYRQKPVVRMFSCSLDELAMGCQKKLKLTSENPTFDPRTGEKYVEEKIYTIDVKPGWKSGTKINFKAQGSFPPLTFILKEKPHKFLVRKNNDLIWKCKIADSQANKALKLKLPLPDGTDIEILTNDILPIQNGSSKRIKGKGMPIKGGPERGDLIIKFQVEKSVSRNWNTSKPNSQ